MSDNNKEENNYKCEELELQAKKVSFCNEEDELLESKHLGKKMNEFELKQIPIDCDVIEKYKQDDDILNDDGVEEVLMRVRNKAIELIFLTKHKTKANDILELIHFSVSIYFEAKKIIKNTNKKYREITKKETVEELQLLIPVINAELYKLKLISKCKYEEINSALNTIDNILLIISISVDATEVAISFLKKKKLCCFSRKC